MKCMMVVMGEGDYRQALLPETEQQNVFFLTQYQDTQEHFVFVFYPLFFFTHFDFVLMFEFRRNRVR